MQVRPTKEAAVRAWLLTNYFVVWPDAPHKLQLLADIHNWMARYRVAVLVAWGVAGWLDYRLYTRGLQTGMTLLAVAIIAAAVFLHAYIPMRLDTAESMVIVLPAGNYIAVFAEEWRWYAHALPSDGRCEAELRLRWTGIQGICSATGASNAMGLAIPLPANSTIQAFIADTRKRWEQYYR